MGARIPADLGREEHLAPGHGLPTVADQLLGPAAAVDVGGVPMSDAGSEGLDQGLARLALVGAEPAHRSAADGIGAAMTPGAQADGGGLDFGPTETNVIHTWLSPISGISAPGARKPAPSRRPSQPLMDIRLDRVCRRFARALPATRIGIPTSASLT